MLGKKKKQKGVKEIKAKQFPTPPVQKTQKIERPYLYMEKEQTQKLKKGGLAKYSKGGVAKKKK